MSVIHESLKKASQANEQKIRLEPVAVKVATTSSASWILPLAIFIVMLTAASLIYAYEHDARRRAEEKLSHTLEELSDAHAQVSELTLQKEELQKSMDAQATAFQSQLKSVTDEKESIERARQALESKNLTDEKRISELSGEEVRLRMNKRHILDVVMKLRQKKTAVTAAPAEVFSASGSAPAS